MLNAPRPAFAGTPRRVRRRLPACCGTWAASACHVADWKIQAADAIHAGDRRFFDLDVTWNDQTRRLEGHLANAVPRSSGRRLRARPRLVSPVHGLFSDLKHHDMGDGLRGARLRRHASTRVWRTPPLWGVGSASPWGHDGALADARRRDPAPRRRGRGLQGGLDRRHARAARDRVLDFLRKLRSTTSSPCPPTSTATARSPTTSWSRAWTRATSASTPSGSSSVPVEIQGPFVNVDGVTVTSFAAHQHRRGLRPGPAVAHATPTATAGRTCGTTRPSRRATRTA